MVPTLLGKACGPLESVLGNQLTSNHHSAEATYPRRPKIKAPVVNPGKSIATYRLRRLVESYEGARGLRGEAIAIARSLDGDPGTVNSD